MNKIKIYIICLFVTIFFSNPSYAYLDPGTGNMILQALAGLFAAGATAGSIYWQKLKILAAKIFKKQDPKKED